MPRDLFQDRDLLEAVGQQVAPMASLEIQGALSTIAGEHPLRSMLRGAIGAPQQLVSDVGQLARRYMPPSLSHLYPQVSPPTPEPGAPYAIGRSLGELGTFLGGGEALEAGRGAAEALPYIGRAAEALGGAAFGPTAARQAIGTGLYGGITSPQQPVRGVEMGAVLGGAGAIIPKIFGAFSPEMLSNKIVNHLTDSKGWEENNKSLASDIKHVYDAHIGNYKYLQKPILQKVGNDNIYGGPYNEIEGKDSLYKNTVDERPNIYDKNYELQNVHKDFTNNPTFNNAKKLQETLGHEIGFLKSSVARKTASTEDRYNLPLFKEARNNLKTDMNDYLNQVDQTGNMANQYREASDYYRNNIVPYKSTTTLNKISTGETTNPGSLINEFKNPEPTIEGKIANDIGQTGKNKILYTALGKDVNKLTPSKLVDRLNKLDDQGLRSYVHPDLNSVKDELQRKIAAKNLLKMGIGGTAGIAATKMLGGSMPLEIMGGIVGGGAFPAVGAQVSKLIPKMSPTALKYLSTILKGATKGIAIPEVLRQEGK